MLQAFYNAALGAQQQMQRMNVQGNNISNVNTYGYKGEKPAFGVLMHGMVNGIDGAELPKGAGALMASAATDFGDAAVMETGRSQDYAIIGEGFFALYEPATGEISFTRDGSFTLTSYEQDKDGGVVWYLSDGEGRQVLNTGGYPIVVEDQEAVQPVGVFTIQYKDGLLHAGSGRFVATAGSGATYAGTSEVRQGFLESSNVDLAAELGQVIEAQRSYSYALKMVATADEVETTVNNLTN